MEKRKTIYENINIEPEKQKKKKILEMKYKILFQ